MFDNSELVVKTTFEKLLPAVLQWCSDLGFSYLFERFAEMCLARIQNVIIQEQGTTTTQRLILLLRMFRQAIPYFYKFAMKSTPDTLLKKYLKEEEKKLNFEQQARLTMDRAIADEASWAVLDWFSSKGIPSLLSMIVATDQNFNGVSHNFVF